MKTITAALLATTALATTLWAAENAMKQTIHSQPSWMVRTSSVGLSVTELGGHMAPVTFYLDSGKPVQPYYISPWQDEKLTPPVPVLGPLRGDFFCMPFGGNDAAYQGEKHPPHGETAGSRWSLSGTDTQGGVTTLTLTLNTKVRAGKVTKRLSLVEGQNVVYSQHVIEGFAGKAPLGHHATLAVPEKEGSLRLASSSFQLGMTNPGLFSDPAKQEYQALQMGARFRDLRKVPAAWKGAPDADCSSYPARLGHADLLALFKKAGSDPAWMTAANPEAGYLWFSLKDAAVLPATVFWMENHGRYEAPWNGRNRCLGLEDVCAYFADGIVPSTTPNVVNEAGFPTAIELSAQHPTTVNYIEGVVKIPASFERVKSAKFTPGQVTFTSTNGEKVTAPVRYEFLKTGKL